jgi:hypothetical protein
MMAVRDIESNVRRRGRPGKAINASYQQYGEFGLKIRISIGGSRGGNTGGRTKSGKYSILIASRIFLSSEQGKIGRRAFSLPMKIGTSSGKVSGGYIVSHSSGPWRKGQRLIGPLSIPQIGPFHFSSQSGMKREKISTMARNSLKGYLNKYYESALSKKVK